MDSYSTLQASKKVTDCVFTNDQVRESDERFKYVIKDNDGKLLCHIVFKTKDNEGIAEQDLLEVIIDRLKCQQEISVVGERGYAIARARESLLWLKDIKEDKKK